MKQQILRPEFLGLDLMRRFEANHLERFISQVGFNPNETWGLLSLETYEGRMEDLAWHLEELMEILDRLAYVDRKTFTWIWPQPIEGDDSPADVDTPGMLQLVPVPRGTKKPSDLSRLEFIDIHSQLVGRVGLELLRFEELTQMWCVAAEQKMRIVTAGISRSILESTAALFSLTKKIAEQWTACKMTSGLIYTTSTGGKVDRSRAIAAQELRKILWASRYEMHLQNSPKGTDRASSLTEWRHPKLLDELRERGLKFRDQATSSPQEPITSLVRKLSTAVSISSDDGTLIQDYDLLSNVVHPSLGGFRLYSSADLSDHTSMFSYTQIGRGLERTRHRNGNNEDADVTTFGHFAHSICRSALVGSQMYLSVLGWMLAIADDIALTAGVEELTLHKTWRYPINAKNERCSCEWGRRNACVHLWDHEGPSIPTSFEFSLKPEMRNPLYPASREK